MLHPIGQGPSIGGPWATSGPQDNFFGPVLISNNVMWHENSNTASESGINLHCVYTRRERRGATKYNRNYSNQRCCLHWMWRSVKNPNSKLLTHSIYDVLTQSSNLPLNNVTAKTWQV